MSVTSHVDCRYPLRSHKPSRRFVTLYGVTMVCVALVKLASTPLPHWLLFVVLAAAIGAALPFILPRLRDPALVVDTQGIDDRRSEVGNILWREVRYVWCEKPTGCAARCLCIALRADTRFEEVDLPKTPTASQRIFRLAPHDLHHKLEAEAQAGGLVVGVDFEDLQPGCVEVMAWIAGRYPLRVRTS